MFFADAIKFLASSQRIRRHGWTPGAVIEVHPSYGIIQKSIVDQPAHNGFNSQPWEPRLTDLITSDWEVYVTPTSEPQPKTVKA